MSAALYLLSFSSVAAATYSALPSKDTYADEANPTANYYGGAGLALSTTSGARKRIYLQFALPTIPATEEVQSVVIRLWTKDGAGAPVDAFRITADWTSTSVSWNAQPSFGSTVRGTFSPVTNGAFADLDITPLSRSWYGGSLINYGVALVARSGTGSAVFQSQNSTPDSQDPQLIVTTVTKPQLELTESSVVVSDPFRGATAPKRIPGAVLQFVLTLVNRAAGSNDANTLDIKRQVPPMTSLFVGDLGAAGSGPVSFAQGAPPSGLTYTYSGLASTTDDLASSNDGGVTYAYTPTPDASGYDATVTHIRLTPRGAVAPSGPAGQPSFTASMRVLAR